MKCTISFLFLLAWTASAATGNGNQCDVKSLRVAKVVTPDTRVLYDESRAQWASQMGSKSYSDFMLRPDAIAYCKSDMDVVATVAFASRCGYSITPRSGGHQYAGHSSCKKTANKCIQLDVSSLDKFSHDPATDIVTIGAGVRLGNLIGQHLVPLGLIIPLGACNGVAAGGHFQSSAAGPMQRPFGLGIDYVESFRIVTADAEILTVTPSSHPDLYKAVLGGGPGSFGVVLDYTVQALRSDAYPNTWYTALITPYTRAAYDIILPLYMEVSAIPEYARDLIPYLTIAQRADQGADPSQHYITILLGWTGIDNAVPFVEDGHYANTVQRFLDTGLFFPAFDGPLPLHVVVDQSRTDFDYGSNRYYVDQFESEKPYSNEMLALIGDEIDLYFERIPNVSLNFQFQVFGGTGEGSGYNRNTGKNAFPTRKVFVSNDQWVFYPETTTGDEDEVRDIMTYFANQRKKLAPPAGLVSDVKVFWLATDPLTAHTADLSKDWPDYYPNQEAFAYLQGVKQQYDPDDVFSSDMTIPLP